VTYLSRLAKLGIIKEPTQYTYTPPGTAIAFTKGAFEDVYVPLKDESIRTNDSVLQGLYQGPGDATWDIETLLYPDLVGHFLRAVIGPDTVVAGVSTTLSTSSTIGATSIQSAVSIPALSVIQITDAGGLNQEYAVTGTPTGTGPYTLPITTPAGGLKFAHTAPTCTIVAQSQHTFAQNRTFSTVWPTYSITVNEGASIRGFPGCVASELQLKIDPKGIVTVNVKYMGFPSAIVSDFSPSYSNVIPLLGWQWTMTNAGASSTRGLTLDLTVKRQTESVHSSDGIQAPREIFPGALEIDGAYKAIFENETDLGLYLNYSQQPTVATLNQPLASGGASLAITMSKSGYHKGMIDLHGTAYVQASFDFSGIYNATDVGITSMVLKNFTASAY
jgi:hypothetical protein